MWLAVLGMLALPLFTTPEDIQHPVWTSLPSERQLVDIYPPEPNGDPDQFTIILRCRIVSADGRVHCIQVAEDPAGFEVGQRAERAFSSSAKLDMSKTQGAKVGRVVVFQLVLKSVEKTGQ